MKQNHTLYCENVYILGSDRANQYFFPGELQALGKIQALHFDCPCSQYQCFLRKLSTKFLRSFKLILNITGTPNIHFHQISKIYKRFQNHQQ